MIGNPVIALAKSVEAEVYFRTFWCSKLHGNWTRDLLVQEPSDTTLCATNNPLVRSFEFNAHPFFNAPFIHFELSVK